MIALKEYQHRVLSSLRDFLDRVSRGVPLSQAFHDVQLANDRPPAPYIPVVAGGQDVRAIMALSARNSKIMLKTVGVAAPLEASRV